MTKTLEVNSLPAENSLAKIPTEELVSAIESQSKVLLSVLKDLKPMIEEVWRRLEAGETIRGCTTKKEFSEKVLGKTYRAVHYMLNGRSEQSSCPEPAEEGRIRKYQVSLENGNVKKLVETQEIPRHQNGNVCQDCIITLSNERGFCQKHRMLDSCPVVEVQDDPQKPTAAPWRPRRLELWQRDCFLACYANAMPYTFAFSLLEFVRSVFACCPALPLESLLANRCIDARACLPGLRRDA